MPTKRKTKSHVAAKAQKPSTYAAISALAAGLAPLFPQYSAIIATVGILAGTVGTLMPATRAEVEAP